MREEPLLTERSGERDERLDRTPLLPLAEECPDLERTLSFGRAAEVRGADEAARRPDSRRTDTERLSRGAGVAGCVITLRRVVRSRETSSRRGRRFASDTATRSATRPGPGSRLDACEDGRESFLPLDLGFDREPPLDLGLAREPPLAFGRERDGVEGLARDDPDLPVGFVDLVSEGSDSPRGAVALGRSRVCRGLAIFL